MELKSAAEDLGKAQEAFNKTKAEDERLSDIIAEKEKLADGVEKAIAERIQKARENAADFIASMAFVGGQPVQIVGTTTPTSVDAASELDMAVYRTFPEFEHLMNLKHITLGRMLSTQQYLNLQRQVLLNNTEVASLRFFVLLILKNSHFYLLVPMQLILPKHFAQL